MIISKQTAINISKKIKGKFSGSIMYAPSEIIPLVKHTEQNQSMSEIISSVDIEIIDESNVEIRESTNIPLVENSIDEDATAIQLINNTNNQ